MNKKAIVIKDLLKFKYPENLQYSPDGKYLAFQVAQANEKKNDYERTIWLRKDNDAKPFSETGNVSLINWDDNETMVITRRKEDDIPGTTTLYKLNVNGGEAQKWITLPFGVSSIKKVQDNLYIATGGIDVNDPDAYKDSDEVRKKKIEEKKKDADYTIVDEVPYWFNGAGYINKQRNALFELRIKEDVEIKRITPKNFDVDEFIVEGKKVYYVGNTKDRRMQKYNKVYAYNTQSKKVEVVYGKSEYSFYGLFVLKGQLYAQASDMKEYGVNETANFVKVGKNTVEFVLDPHRQLFSSIVGDTMLGGGKGRVAKENGLYTLVTDEDHIGIWKYDTNFKKTTIYDELGAVFFLDVSDKKIAFAKETENSLGEIYEMDLNGKNIKKITNLNGDVLKDKYIAKPQTIHYTSGEEKLHGWVLLPDNFNPKKKYPAILDVHGGPRCVYGTEYFHEMQVWAAKGYVVMFTNIRGSDGRDDEFADIRGKYGEVDFENLMDFTDAVLEKYPNINKKKLCETGGSYGGFMTNWIITHTNRFCCAASQRSISNWISMSFMSDIGLYFGPDQCGADGLFGDKNIEKLWKHSPLKYAKGVKTPTLFIHSDEDYRCPLPEGMQMMQALAIQNVETRLVVFHGENHELSRGGKPLHRIKRLEEITNWFDQHTK